MLKKIAKLLLVFTMVCMQFTLLPVVKAKDQNLALHKPVIASGTEGGKKDDGEWMYPHLAPDKITDGDAYSRWSSDATLTDLNLENNPDQNVWFYVDLEEEQEIGKIVLKWDTVCSRNYDIQISNDAKEWETLKHYEDPDLLGSQYDETLELAAPRTARYIRMYARVSCQYIDNGNLTWYAAISVREIEVYEASTESGQTILENICKEDPSLSSDGKRILLPKSPDDTAQVGIYSTSNPAIIDAQGNITQPLETMDVNVFYSVTDAKGQTFHADVANKITIPGKYTKEESSNERPAIIPGIREWKGDEGSFSFTGQLVLQDASMQQSAETIQMYMQEMLKKEVSITVGTPKSGDIYLMKGEHQSVGEEGYELMIDDILTIQAPSEKGLLYGGTSVTQILYQDSDHMQVPKGIARDYPQYAVRAVMIDVARMYLPLDYVEEITRYAAYYKINEVRLHISDDGGEQDAAFRVESKKHPELNQGIEGKVYSQEDYKNYQKEVKKYGVEVITEVDTPAHSVIFGKLRPDLLTPDGSHLDVSNPETITFIKDILDEFLDGDDPVFQGDKFHIGTDEYDKSYAEDVRKYMDELITYVNGKGRETRMWASLGTNGFDGVTPVNTNATAHIWSHGWASWKEMLDDGYNLINNADGALYIVPEGAYNNYINIERLFNTWEVSDLLYGNHLDMGHPQLLGAESAIWYDAANGQSEFDYFDRMRDQIMLMSEKNWYGEKTAGQNGSEFIERVNRVNQYAPKSNPARYVASEDTIVASYDFKDTQDTIVPDHSKNGYDATLHGLKVQDNALQLDGKGYLSLPFDSLGYPYTVQFDLRVDEKTPSNAILFDGKDGTLYYDYEGSGKIAYKRKGYIYMFDFTLPKGVTSTYTITCNGQDAALYVDGYKAGTGVYYQQTIAWQQKSSTFVLPSERIGAGIIGTMKNLKLYNKQLSDAEVLGGNTVAYRNAALHKQVEASSVDGGLKEDGTYVNPDFAPELAVDGDRATRHVFSRREEDSWFIVDLGEEYLIDQYTIRFMEIPVSYKVSISLDGEHWEEVALRKDLPGRASIADGVSFDQIYHARYVKYEQLEMFEIEGYGLYSGYFNEFEVYGYEASAIQTIIDQAKDALKNCTVNEHNEAYLTAFKENIERMERTDTYTLEELTQAGALLQQQTNHILEATTIDYQLDRTKLLELINNPTISEDDFDEVGWLAYQKAVSYGKVIYADLHTSQELFDEARRQIMDLIDQIPAISIRTTMPAYVDAQGKEYGVNYMMDHDLSTKAWFTRCEPGDTLSFKFKEPQLLSSVKISLSSTGWDLMNPANVEVSMDKENWTKVGETQRQAVNELKFDEIEARYVRITITEGSGWADIGEVEFGMREQTVDTSKLEALLQEQYTEEAYTPNSYAKYLAVKTEAEELLKDAAKTQEAIDKAIVDLQDAIDQLQQRANTKALQMLIEKAAGYVEASFTPESYDVMKRAWSAAEALVQDLNVEQSAVDQAYTTLEQAIDALQQRADKQQLQLLIEEIKSMNLDTFTPASVQQLQAALTHALNFMKDENVDQAAVTQEFILLMKARDQLVSHAVLDALRLLHEQAVQVMNSDEIHDVRPGKVEALRLAITEANMLLEAQSEDVAAIKAATLHLYQSLQELYKIVDKGLLNSLLQSSTTLKEETYTSKSWQALQTAVKQAEAIVSNEDATSEDVQTAYDAVANAIAQLQLRSNKQALASQLKYAETMLAQQDKYVSSSIANLEHVYKAAKAVFENEDATQKEVTAATQTLIKELAKARLKADKVLLENVLKQAKAMDLTGYAASGVQAVKQEIAAAAKVMANEAASQADVDKAERALTNALQGLVKKGEETQVMDKGGQSKAASTADATQTLTWLILLMCAGAGLMVLRNRKKA